MIGFKDLKFIIQKNCKAEQSEDGGGAFKFCINVDNLENSLSQKSDLHVLAFTKTIESHIPDPEELQFITEYVQSKEEVKTIMNGHVQIANLIVYCDMEGQLQIGGDDDYQLTTKEISDKVNCENPDKSIAALLTTEFPIYRILIVRKFDAKRDQFTYIEYFRSNYAMVGYIKELRAANKFMPENKNDKEVE